MLKLSFCITLEGHEVFDPKIQLTIISQIFSTDFDHWVTKVNSGIGMELVQEGR